MAAARLHADGALRAPIDGLELRRTVGRHATRFWALHKGRTAGWVEVRADLTAADWLRLGRVERMLDYAIEGEDEAHLAFAKRLCWRELARTQRDWRRG